MAIEPTSLGWDAPEVSTMTVVGRIMASQKRPHPENSLAIQWLGLRVCTAKGSIPGQETKIPQAELPKKKKKRQQKKVVESVNV